MERLNTGDPRALIRLHQEPQRRNEAEDNLQLQHHETILMPSEY